MSVKIDTSPYRNHKGELVRHLTINGAVWMSSEDVEYEDIYRALSTAKGNCYIGGLGLGIITEECAKLESVVSVDVVEFNKEVIDVSSEFIFKRMSKKERDKVKIHQGDAREFFPGTYDWMYFDIWIDINRLAAKLMKECFVNARPYLNKDGVLEGWLKPDLETLEET